MPLRFEKITTHKKRFLDLLLLADEQESMIDRYLERGEMFVARDDGQVVAECVVTDEADRIGEIKNLAVPLQYQRKGYGRQMLEFLEAHYRDRYRTLLVGTGDVKPMQLIRFIVCVLTCFSTLITIIISVHRCTMQG